MSCELKYRFTSSQCEIVNNIMLSLWGKDMGFIGCVSLYVSITLFFFFLQFLNVEMKQTGRKYRCLILLFHFPSSGVLI